jgi:hypothetical protein
MTKTLKKELDNIMDVFTGADGGVDFCKLRFALEEFEATALKGNAASLEIIGVVMKFSKLLDIIKERVK